MEKFQSFGDMTPNEIEQLEKKTNTIVLFDCEKGIAFQFAKSNDDVNGLAIMADDFELDNVLVIDCCEITMLKDILNRNF